MSLKRSLNLLILFCLVVIALTMVFLPTQIAYAATIDNNAFLSSLEVEGYQLDKKFDKNQEVYVVSVPFATSNIVINAIPENVDANINIQGNLNLSVGGNLFYINVTATDNKTTKRYTLTVQRSSSGTVESGDNNLIGLKVEGYALDPKFEPSILEYKLTVSNEVESVKITYVQSHLKAKAELIGPKKLAVGANNYVVKVTAPNKDVKEYKIEITRSTKREKSTNNNLQSLKILDGETEFQLSPEFKSDTLAYTIDVLKTTRKVTINAIAEDQEHATVQIIGGTNLEMGKANQAVVAVTSEVGETKEYKITINRPVGINNNYLKSLSIDGYNLTPKFDKNTFEYKIRIKYTTSDVTVRWETEDPLATVVRYGGYNLEAEKENVVQVVVYAQNQDIRIYKITLIYSKETDAIGEGSANNKPSIKPGDAMPGGTTLGIPSWLLGVILAIAILVIAVISTVIATFVPRKYKVKKDKVKKDTKKKEKAPKEKTKEEEEPSDEIEGTEEQEDSDNKEA